jgi:hypothetical protein
MRQKNIESAIVRALKTKPLTFTELREKVSELLNKPKDKPIRNKNLSENLHSLKEKNKIIKILKNGKECYKLVDGFFEQEIDEIYQASFFDIKKRDFLIDWKFPIIALSSERKISPLIKFLGAPTNLEEIIYKNITDTLLINFEKLNENNKRGIIELFGSAFLLEIKEWFEKLKNDFEKIKEEKIDEKRFAFYSKILESINQKNLGDFLLKFYEAPKVLSNEGLSIPPDLKLKEIKEKKTEEEAIPFKTKILLENIDGDIDIIYRIPFEHIHSVLYKKIKNPYLKRYPHIYNAFVNLIFFKNLNYLKNINYENAERKLQTNLKYLEVFEELVQNTKIIISVFHGFPLEAFEEKSLLPFFRIWYNALKKGELDHRRYLFTNKTINKIKKAIRNIKIGLFPLNEKIDFKETWTLQYLYFEHPDGKKLEFWKNLLEAIKERKKILEKKETIEKQ